MKLVRIPMNDDMINHLRFRVVDGSVDELLNNDKFYYRIKYYPNIEILQEVFLDRRGDCVIVYFEQMERYGDAHYAQIDEFIYEKGGSKKIIKIDTLQYTF